MVANPETINSEAEKLLKTIKIPAQPQILLDLNKETSANEPDFQKISSLIAKDAALTARIIKLVNSPIYGLSRQIESINQAVALLGISNFKNIVLASVTKQAIEVDETIYEKFWTHTDQIAHLSEMIAKKNPHVDAEHAYMAGLFHDCAAPLILRKYPDYIDFIDFSDGRYDDIIGVENTNYNTNHAIMGYIMAKSWKLPPVVSLAIQNHHEPNLEQIDDLAARRLVAILVLADYINHQIKVNDSAQNFETWHENHNQIIIELDISEYEINELFADARELLIQL